MASVTVELPYRPRPQFLPFHSRTQRWGVLVVHRRAGKTVSAINDLIKGALTCPLQAPRFAYVAPSYAQAKDVAWSYLKRYMLPIPGTVAAESELHVTAPGDRRVRLYGADNYDRMRGIYLDGCVIDEPADMDPQAWFDVIRPALSDRRGWCVWIGTPKGRDAFYKLWKDATGRPDEWFTMRLPASESGILPPDELESAKRGMQANPGAFDREYECSFETPVAGSIYGELITQARQAKRIVPFEVDRSAPIFSSWDLGWNDCTSIWLWQIVGRDICWIWHTRKQGKTAAEMALEVMNCGFPVAAHYLPHDAVNGNAATGTNYRAELQKAGLSNIHVVPRCVNIWSGINQLRDIIARSWFRLPACASGLEALEAYHTKDVGQGVITKEPVHDWTSHDADAARMMAEALNLGMVNPAVAKRAIDAIPRYPDGSMANSESIAEQRRARRSGVALSGPTF